MGSGDKFRTNWHKDYWSIGLTVIPNGEHTLSIHIELIVFNIYIGIGKGYDETF